METQYSLQDKERAWDWVTALSPIFIISYFYYRFAAAGFVLLGVAGYLAATVLLCWGRPALGRIPAALACGMLTALFLPSTAPMWVAAPAGALAGLLAELPDRLAEKWSFRLPMLVPPLAGILLVRLAFAGFVSEFVMPLPWTTADNPLVPGSLAFLGQPFEVETCNRWVLGVYGGPLGEGCVPVIVLAGLYLLLRRRLRLIVPAVMLATVSLLSWAVWNAPVYGLLVGGTVLSALVLADRAYAPTHWGAQVLCGLVAGGLTVLIRALTPADGCVTAVLLAVAVSAVYPFVFRFFGWVYRKFSALFQRFFAKTENKC